MNISLKVFLLSLAMLPVVASASSAPWEGRDLARFRAMHSKDAAQECPHCLEAKQSAIEFGPSPIAGLKYLFSLPVPSEGTTPFAFMQSYSDKCHLALGHSDYVQNLDKAFSGTAAKMPDAMADVRWLMNEAGGTRDPSAWLSSAESYGSKAVRALIAASEFLKTASPDEFSSEQLSAMSALVSGAGWMTA